MDINAICARTVEAGRAVLLVFYSAATLALEIIEDIRKTTVPE
jgi:hypothetical protein